MILVAAAACSNKQPVNDQLTAEVLYDQALAKLHNRKWTDAIEMFERFTIQFPQHPRVQEARFRLAEGYFGKKEYITAATDFSRLANDYPAGPFADDARFKVCESYYKLSPKPQLDQLYTRSALDHCQSLISYYETSDFTPKAREMLLDLRTKLALKEYIAAEFYFKNKAYDSAIIYYELAVRNYADTPIAPRALMRLYETYQILNYKDEADAAKARLLKDYPTSPEAKLLPATAAS